MMRALSPCERQAGERTRLPAQDLARIQDLPSPPVLRQHLVPPQRQRLS
jgi:hypothetical protein